MDLINHTVAQAALYISEVTEEWRTGFLVAKVTCVVTRDGELAPDTDNPIPILDVDVPTELGSMPCDLVTRMDTGVDVVLLGAAYAPQGRPVEAMDVTLRVGDVSRKLRVTGDRHWLGTGDDATPSVPSPFVRMPLTWSRAFGGGGEVWIDPHTMVPLHHPGNPSGRGFDLAKHSGPVGRTFGSPDGFPGTVYVRTLPNLEHPVHAVARWDDDPEPYCWGAVPSEFITYRVAKQARIDSGGRIPANATMPHTIGHPDWRLPALAPGTPVVLEGCTPEGAWWFHVPPVRVEFDYELGSKRGTRTLQPFLMTLMPDESRMVMTLRSMFKFSSADGAARSIRLRVES